MTGKRKKREVNRSVKNWSSQFFDAPPTKRQEIEDDDDDDV